MSSEVQIPSNPLSTDRLRSIVQSTDAYNFHSHTQFCDGKATMEDMASEASRIGLKHYGFSPHSPIRCESGANMKNADVGAYLAETRRIAELYPDVAVYAGMEVDYLAPDWGAHIPYFADMPLDYRISSVHFVRTRRGEYVDCDGSPERFQRYLKDYFASDLQYVVEKFFDTTLEMVARGGFDILGHVDKIARNASSVDPGVERTGWYRRWMTDVVAAAIGIGVAVEINTKAYADTGRFFPAAEWWETLVDADVPLIVNSDAHYPDRISAGRPEAIALLREITARRQKQK